MAEQKVSRLWAYFLALSESSALSAIRAAVITLLLYGLFAAVFFTNVEGWTTVEAIYFSMVTMSTVGYGDLAPTIWYSRLVGVAFILVGIILVFVQVGGVMGLFAKPLFDRIRVLADDLWAPQYVPFTDETGSHKIEAPRRPLIFYTKGLVGPITILLLFQFFSAAIFIWVEPDWDLQTAIWYVMVTATTVGYGDVSVSKSNAWAMAWASLHILLSVSLLAALIEDITELKKKRKDMLTQVFQFKKCHEKATLTDLDADDTGSVDEAEAETKTPAITPEERQLILVQVAKACVYLQKHQLIHRDLRPCNVQICRRGRRCQVKILDFGVMIAAERSLRQCQSSAVRVFGANRTPQDGYDWLPPEVWTKGLNFEWPAHSFDMFSLGVLWLNLLLGHDGMKEVMLQVARQVPWATSARWKVIPEEAAQILEKLLQASPKRPEPLEVLAALAPGEMQPLAARMRPVAPTVKAVKGAPWVEPLVSYTSSAAACVPSIDLTPPPKEIVEMVVETPPPPPAPFKTLFGAEAALQQMASEMGDLLRPAATWIAGSSRSRKRPSGDELMDPALLFRMRVLLKEVERCRMTCQSLQGIVTPTARTRSFSPEVEILS